METRINGIKRIATVSFSMIYLALALTYMHLLPNYNSLLRNGYYYPGHHVVIKTGSSLTAGGHHAMVQKLFYATTPENKRDVLTRLVFIVAVATTLFAIILSLTTRAYQAQGSLTYYALSRRHAYLQFRSLRI